MTDHTASMTASIAIVDSRRRTTVAKTAAGTRATKNQARRQSAAAVLRQLSLSVTLWSVMIEIPSNAARIGGIARIGSQPIALAAATLILVLVGVGSVMMWRAYSGTSPAQDRIASARQLQARTAQASQQLVEKTKGLEANQHEAIDP